MRRNTRSTAVAVVCAIGLASATVGSNPVLHESPAVKKTGLANQIGPREIAMKQGSVVVKDADAQPGGGLPFDAAVFAQMPQTGDVTPASGRYVRRAPLRGLGNHIELDHGVLVAMAPEVAPALGTGPQENVERRRPYPLTTIRSIGAGAEGATVIIAVTTGILSQPPTNPDHRSVDVVMLYLSGDDDSMLYAMEEEPAVSGTRFVPRMSLKGDRRDQQFISVNLVLDARGRVVSVGQPQTQGLAGHQQVRELRETLQTLQKLHGDRFWEPGL